MKNKLSILLPHLDRSILAIKTLNVYLFWLKSYDMNCEILVADDNSENCEYEALERYIRGCRQYPGVDIELIRVKGLHEGSQAVMAFNQMAEKATGDVFAITQSESYPANISFLRKAATLQDGTYIVGSCWALSPLATMKQLSLPVSEHIFKPEMLIGDGRGEWYQHSVHRNRQLHFFGLMTRNDWFTVGGMPDEYRNAVGKEDVVFVANTKKAGINVVSDDEILVFHQNHYGGPYRNGHDGFRKWSV